MADVTNSTLPLTLPTAGGKSFTYTESSTRSASFTPNGGVFGPGVMTQAAYLIANYLRSIDDLDDSDRIPFTASPSQIAFSHGLFYETVNALVAVMSKSDGVV